MGNIVSDLLSSIVTPLLATVINTAAGGACETAIAALDLPAGYTCSACTLVPSNVDIFSLTSDFLATATCGGTEGSGTFMVGKEKISAFAFAEVASGTIFMGADAKATVEEIEISCKLLGTVTGVDVTAQTIESVTLAETDLPLIPLEAPSECSFDGVVCSSIVVPENPGLDSAFVLTCGAITYDVSLLGGIVAQPVTLS